MNWLAFVILAVFFDVIRIFTDNYISDVYFKGREVASQKMFTAYAKPIASIIILIIAGLSFGFGQFDASSVVALIFAGILLGIAEVPYYLALGIEDSTNIGIFSQLAPIFYLILGWLFLGDTFSPLQLAAIAIILVAPLLIVLTSRKRNRKVKIHAILLALLYITIKVIGNLIFVKVNANEFDLTVIVESIALTILGTGIADFSIMQLFPKWRKRYHHVKKASKNRVLLPLSTSFITGILYSFTYRFALVAAPAVALASAASDSVEPIAIFFMGIVFTLIWPRFGREKLDKKTVMIHFLATIIVVIGIILMQL